MCHYPRLRKVLCHIFLLILWNKVIWESFLECHHITGDCSCIRWVSGVPLFVEGGGMNNFWGWRNKSKATVQAKKPKRGYPGPNIHTRKNISVEKSLNGCTLELKNVKWVSCLNKLKEKRAYAPESYQDILDASILWLWSSWCYIKSKLTNLYSYISTLTFLDIKSAN